jgi:hypothetical protein
VKNKFDSLMMNGDSIIGDGWYMELLIIPFPDDTSKYYLFSAGVTPIYGLFYSVIDMNLDSGKGSIIQKNVQLLTDPANDGLIGVKHGNGRDWWLLFRNDGYYAGGPNNKFYKFLITPVNVLQVNSQNIGTNINSGFQKMAFNNVGNKLALAAAEGLIEMYDFDRCTGFLSNHILIRPQNFSPPSPRLFGCDFSPSSRFLYVSSNGTTISHLIQIDLQNATPWVNADTIWTDSIYPYLGGALRLAPDNKIYLSCAWNSYVVPNFPYPDTTYDVVNTHLSVINYPDSLDTACNFTPFSFYLGGGRTYWGLPNNPDYDMPRLQGSVCDTVQWMGVQTIEPQKGEMFVTYVSDWQKLFINAQHLSGTTYTLTVIDITGRLVYKEKGRLHSPYFTKDLDCTTFSGRMYIIIVTTDRERLSKKFIKN